MAIPVIDIFAGPGGLGEGFSSLIRKKQRVFDIRLSIEKDTEAHKTLELRSFVRQFLPGKFPKEYYQLIQESDLQKRDKLREELFTRYPAQAETAKNEAWLAELGSPDFPSKMVDDRIKKALGGTKNWILIGGPPCQAYSLVGRSRRQEIKGLNVEDHRVFLYKEYLRIIAMHRPAVFVMENVKGLLSAKLGEEKVFNWILNDLRNPSIAFPETKCPGYRVFSLTTAPHEFGENGQPLYKKDRDYLIRAEDYGVPQKRHRVILLGVREDIDHQPDVLKKQETGIKLKDVIGDLPRLRSGINRSFDSSEMIETLTKNGEKKWKKKRHYINLEDSDSSWKTIVERFRKEIISWNGFTKEYKSNAIATPRLGTGSEFVECQTPSKDNPLFNWYHDPKLKGVANHESRSHLKQDLLRYMFSSMYAKTYKRFPRLDEYEAHSDTLVPDHENAMTGKFADRFRVQVPNEPATTVTSHISKDGHYFIHYDPDQCRSLTVREAARIQTFPDNYLFCGSRTAQFHQVGNAVPPYLARQIGDIVLGLFNKMNND